jgi:hypothetical protein
MDRWIDGEKLFGKMRRIKGTFGQGSGICGDGEVRSCYNCY